MIYIIMIVGVLNRLLFLLLRFLEVTFLFNVSSGIFIKLKFFAQ